MQVEKKWERLEHCQATKFGTFYEYIPTARETGKLGMRPPEVPSSRDLESGKADIKKTEMSRYHVVHN